MIKYLGCPSHTFFFFFQTLCNILMVWQNFFSKCTISVVLDLFITVKNTWSQQSLKNMPFPILKATGSKHPSSLDSQLLLDKLRENGPGFERATWQDIVFFFSINIHIQWDWKEDTVLRVLPAHSGTEEKTVLRVLPAFLEDLSWDSKTLHHLAITWNWGSRVFVSLSRPFWGSNTWTYIHTCTH